MKFILGTKLGMSQIFDEQGRVVPVTLVVAGPCTITQIKSRDKDGYNAVQIGFGFKKKLSKAYAGHLKGLEPFRWIREYRLSQEGDVPYKRGDVIDISLFEKGEKVRVRAISKGKGFQGVVKRWGFAGSSASHGQKSALRAPGSIGSGFPQHVRKGMKMGGRMGADRVTTRMQVVKVDAKNRVIMLGGPVAGPRGGLVEIRA